MSGEKGHGEWRKRVRPETAPSVWNSPRFRVGLVLTILTALLIASVLQIISVSPMSRRNDYHREAVDAFNRKDYATAAILFRRYLELDPERAQVWYALGICRIALEKRGEGVEALRRAVQLEPGLNLALIALSREYRRTGNYRAAVRSARRATDKDPVPSAAWTALGDAMIALGDRDGAIRAFRRAVEMDPDLVEILLKLGDLYTARGEEADDDISRGFARQRYQQAEARLRELIDISPRNVKLHLLLAKARAGQGVFADAIREIGKVIEEEPEEPTHRHLLARFHEAIGDLETAISVLEGAMEVTPTARIAIRLAVILESLPVPDTEEALMVLERAVDRFPLEAAPRIALIAHHLRRGRPDEAGEVMRQALLEFPEDSLVLEARGDVFLVADEKESAVAAWRDALHLHPENLSARRKIIRILLPRVLSGIDRAVDVSEDRDALVADLDFFLDTERGVNPLDPRARAVRARLASAEGDFELARELLLATGADAPKSYLNLKVLGLASLKTGDYFGAADALYKALKHKDGPRTADDYTHAYSATFRTGNVPREIEIARDAVGTWPRNADWRLRLATSLSRDGLFDQALSECRAAKALLAVARDVRAHLLAARIYQAKQDLLNARRELEDAVLVRRDAETRGALYAFFAATGDGALAETGFRALIQENPDDPEVYLRFGDFLMKSGDAEGALFEYRRAQVLSPASREANYRLAELRMALAANEEVAIAAAEEAVSAISKADPDDPYILYFTGKLHILRGEYPEAVASLTRYVGNHRNEAAGLYYLAIAHRHHGEPGKAKANFQAALRVDSTLTEALLEMAALLFAEGMRAHRAGEMEQARPAFEEVVRIDPREPHSRRFLASVLASLGAVGAAAEQAEKAVELDPEHPGALMLSGLMSVYTGEIDRAVDRFQTLVRLYPENFRAHLYLGMTHVEGYRLEPGIESLRSAWILAPDEDETIEALALTLILAEKKSEAIRLVEVERDRRRDHAPVHRLLGALYMKVGRRRDATSSLRTAFALSPDEVDALARAAAMIADTGDGDGAILMLTEAARRATRPALLHTLRGRMLQRNGALLKAEAAYRSALEADRAYIPAYRDLGLLLSVARPGESEKLLKEAVNRGLIDPAVLFQLAQLAESRGSRKEAEEIYRQVLELRADNAAALNNLALLLAATPKRRAEALTLAQQARAAAPKEPRIVDTVGWVLYLLERFDEAVELLTEAAQALPGEAEILHHAGMACFKAYRWDEARDFLTRALKLSRGYPLSDEARRTLAEMR